MFDENKIHQIQWYYHWTDREWQINDVVEHVSFQHFFN